MGIFSFRDKKPRIAFREQRDGTKHYFVQTYKIYESGGGYYQESPETTSLKKAEKWLKEITDKEIISFGVLADGTTRQGK